jgi:hypothetical protein
MSISTARRRAGSALIPAGAAVAAVLALAVPVGASTGTREISPEQAGYTATGGQFRRVDVTVYLRAPAQYASEVGEYSHSVQLWSSDRVAVLGLSASTSGSGYTPYAKIYDASTHQLLATDPEAEWCAPACGVTVGSFPAGDTVTLSLRYYPVTGGVNLTAWDITPGADNGWHLRSLYPVGLGESFTQARVGAEFGSDPWTAPASYTHPAAPTKIANYTGVMLQTYNGTYSTLASWFVHHKMFMSTGSLTAIQAAPDDLSVGGANFQAFFMPQSAQSPNQPVRHRPAAPPGHNSGVHLQY